ncbi:condensation domain-containing protein [Chitinophaga niastensis]|uniref:Condensation domain-containing protein n=1 Tax=Chitinophaga niastensis TaxID=536980 RepID=A0A2P8H9C8_CHINA|nr:condensation domain-containing protein [Chitinophaga niastensis]PSL42790.1 condensation domain-containing protein [Chitinophaga niastensis]
MELIKEGIYPLAYGQRHLVQNYESDPKNTFPLRRVYKFQNDFSQVAFKEVIWYLTNKHPSLRLRLLRTSSGWRQQFVDQTAPIVETTVRGLTKAFRKQYGLLLIGEDIKPAIDLEKESPIRLTIFRINKQYYLSLCISHIAADEISFGLFERELVECYQKAIAGNLMQCLASESFEKLILKEANYNNKAENNLKYWYDNLNGIEYLDLPQSKNPLAVAGNYIRIFSCEELDNFKRISAESKYSSLTIIAAIHLLIIYESKKVSDIILSVPFSNRLREEENSIVANIFMPLFVRFKWNPEESILQMLDRIRETLFNAIIHSQFDSRKILAFITSNKGNQNLTRECNFILEEDALRYPNPLFTERLDSMSTGKMVSIGSFHFHARQFSDGVLFKLFWDEKFWSINPETMNVLFNKSYDLICAAINNKE